MKINVLVKTGLSLILILVFLPSQSHWLSKIFTAKAQDDVWTTYSNGNYVNDLAVEGNYLWAATDAGVVRWDIRDRTYIKYTESDGLADNRVEAITIDLDNSKWFGTGNGVSHFDGTTWLTYNTTNSDLADPWVRTIAIESNGDKWFGTNRGVSHFDGTTWITYSPFNSDLESYYIRTSAIDLDGGKWFGFANAGGDGVSHFNGTTWTTYDTSNSGLIDDDVYAIAIDLDGSKWFGTWCTGVSHFDGTSWITYTSSDGLASNCVGAIAIDNEGGKWFGTSNGVTHFDGTIWTTYNTDNTNLGAGWVGSIFIDNNNDQWFEWGGNDAGGISQFDGNTWTTFMMTDPLVHNQVQAIAVEPSGGRWLGTAKGAVWQAANIWMTYTTANSKLKRDSINAIAIDHDYSVWFGVSHGGVTHFDGTTWTTYDTLNSNLADENVLAVAVDLDGSKWFGTRNGVSHFDGTTWTTYNTANSELADNDVHAIAIDVDGSKWFGFGGVSNGVSRFDGTDWMTYTETGDIEAIAIDRNGNKWFGTWHGIDYFDGTTWITYTPNNSGLEENYIKTIDIDNEGGIWFGTNGGGISHFDGTTWITYTPANSGLTDRTVHAIAIDNNGSKWIGFDSGLNKFGAAPDTETYIRVVDEENNPHQGAKVYHQGVPIANDDGVPYQTNALGIFLVNNIEPHDRLMTLAPRHKQSTMRKAHGSSDQNWAYQIYTNNAYIDTQGNITTTQTFDPASGEYLLTTAKNNPLVAFNLVVSIEWDAEDAYIEEIKQAMQSASDYLYDLTDGQMVFGQINIYDQGSHWADADIQISTRNIVRPHAYIGGITSNDPSHVIRVGRGWDGESGNQGAWHQPDGFRTLAHEFGHYALYLYDEYIAFIFDQNGNLTGEVPVSCTGLEYRNPATDAPNASAMDYQHTSSELSAQGVPGLWSDRCEETAQWQLNGESAWETLARKYADMDTPSRWQLTTPVARGNILPGPNRLPSDLLLLPTITISNSGTSRSPVQLTVYDQNGESHWGTIVALYKVDGRVIGQGFTDKNGELAIYGAQAGDTIRAASFDAGLHGHIDVGSEPRLNLTLTPVDSLTTRVSSEIPYLRVIPEPSLGPNQIDLLIELNNFGSGANPNVIITEPGSEIGHAPQMAYSPEKGTYEGQISFSATKQGMGRVRVVGAVNNSILRLQSTYRLQRIINSQHHDAYSDDGNLSLYLEAGSFAGNETYLVVMPPSAIPGPLPDGLILVGDPYQVTASGAQLALQKPGLLRLRYDDALAQSAETQSDLNIYFWNSNNRTWQAITSNQHQEQGMLVATITSLGIYALLAPASDSNEPEEMFLPIVFN